MSKGHWCLCVQAQCQEVRKKKDLELQILTEPIRNWEGDDIKTLGPVLHMSQATVHTQNCQVPTKTSEQSLRLSWSETKDASLSPLMISHIICKGTDPLFKWVID